MIWALRILFLTILGSMLAVTSWASLQCALFAIPREVATHPWFIATLVDAYWAFITFYVWAAWKEQGMAARGLWLLAVLALGNIAMAVNILSELFAVKPTDDLALVFTRRNPGRLVLPGVLVAASVGVYLLA
jgi:hypothetical protein